MGAATAIKKTAKKIHRAVKTVTQPDFHGKRVFQGTYDNNVYWIVEPDAKNVTMFEKDRNQKRESSYTNAYEVTNYENVEELKGKDAADLIAKLSTAETYKAPIARNC